MSTKTGYPSIDKTHLQGIPEELLHPEIHTLSIMATFYEVNKDHMDEPALEHHDQKLTKQELWERSLLTATALRNSGLKAEDRIALVLPNCIDGVVLTFAANAIGIQVAYLDPLAPIDRLKEEIRLLEPKLVIAERKGISSGAIRFESLMGMSNPKNIPEIAEAVKQHATDEGPRIFLQTSGSMSGKPKTLPFTNRAIFAMLMYQSGSTGTKPRDPSVKNGVLSIMPYQHGYGWACIFVNLMGGNKVVLAPGIEPEDIGNYYQLKTAYIYASPIFVHHLMERTPEDADLSALIKLFIAGFSIGEEMYQKVIAWLRKHSSNAEIVNNYGTSEALCTGTAQDGLEHVPGTVGKLHKGPDFLFVDEDLKEVKYDEPGEMLVCAESLCEGYYGDEAATKESFIELNGGCYFRTGDYMSLGEDGYVRFVGRKKRFFQPTGSGDKVNCETIEHAIAACELVDLCAVIVTGKDKDVPDGACAFVKLKEEKLYSELDNVEAELRRHLSEVLQDYQMPHDIIFTREIPVMDSGKPNYSKLEKLYR